MEKEELINSIYDFNKELEGCIEQNQKDIEYKKDLVDVAKKHNKDYGYILNEIKELEVTLRTLKQTKELFTDSLDENNIEMQDIIEYCD